MRRVCLFAIVAIPLCIIARDLNDQVSAQVEIGKNLITQNPITAAETTFPYFIKYISIHDSNRQALVELTKPKANMWAPDKSEKYAALLDLDTKEFLWVEEYQNCKYQFAGDYVYKTFPSRIEKINATTGQILFKETFKAEKIVNDSYALGFKSNLNMLMGMHLDYGMLEWKRKIKNRLGWQQTQMLNDSTMLLLCEGLHLINIKTGEGWDYTINTPGEAASYVARNTYIPSGYGGALGALFEYLVVELVAHAIDNSIKNQLTWEPTNSYGNSNFIVDNDCIYIANMHRLSCLGLDGVDVLTYPLPEELTSSSSIFLRDDKLYLLNEGTLQQWNNPTKKGKPYLACFDAATGKNLFISLYAKAAKVKSSFIDNEYLHVMLKKNVISYSLKNGELHNEINLDKEQYKSRFLPPNFYGIKRADSTYVPMALYDSSHFYIYKAGRNSRIGRKSGALKSRDDYDRFYYMGKFYGYSFYNDNRREVLIMSKDEKEMVKINRMAGFFNDDTTFYMYTDNKIFELDLNQIFPQK